MQKNRLVKLIDEDHEIAEKISQHELSENSLFNLVKDKIPNYTKKEFKNEFRKLASDKKSLNSSSLDKVSGGISSQKDVLLTKEQIKRAENRINKRRK